MKGVAHIETPQEYDNQYAGLYIQIYAPWLSGRRGINLFYFRLKKLTIHGTRY